MKVNLLYEIFIQNTGNPIIFAPNPANDEKTLIEKLTR